ncbi:MAG TPA: ComF family protein [Pyrinomonadaceae bacterium]|nr:ComF family protein [Pyrinomonadaceae bacterium]
MLATRAVNLFYDSCLALLYPQACTICGDSVESRVLGVACEKCWRSTHVFSGNETICWKCGALSLGAVAPEQREAVRCRRCDADAFTVARACGTYEGALRASVLLLKREPHLCRKLVNLLVSVQSQYPLNRATRIISVPLHKEREQARGFNQAAIIGRALADAVSLPIDEISVKRTAHTTRHRAGMDARDRRESVENAFTVAHPALVAGERILLVDDVFTSGATVSACAKVLLQAGAADVFVLTLARPLLF